MARPSEAVGAPGIAITTRPESDGSFLVSEVITLPAPATEAVLRPPSIADAGTRFKQLHDRDAGRGQCRQVLAVPDGPVRSQVTLAGTPHPAAATAPPPDAGERGQPTRQNRPHSWPLSTLLDRMPADLPVKVVVTGRTVLSLTCPQASAGETVLWQASPGSSGPYARFRSTGRKCWFSTTGQRGDEVVGV